MKLLRSLMLSYFTAVLLFLCSCGESKEKTETDKMSSDSVTIAPPAPASTIITTPQDLLVVKHKVSNFEKWQPSYEGHDSARLANGLHSYIIGRGVADSNMVLVAVKADDLAKAKAFGKDAGLKQAMQKGGVIGQPSISFVTMTYQDISDVGSPIRSLTSFTVKDFDAWQKAFQEGTQERIDNGITVRAYGHEADNNNKVVLVTAIMDSAKAAAYWNSDMLKNRRLAAGVIGVPDRFLYRIVKRY